MGNIINLFIAAALIKIHIHEIVQERCDSIANALELRLTCTDPSICSASHNLVCSVV